MKIEYRDGLIFTSIGISYQGHSKIIENIVIDTGAAGSIISPDAVDDIGVIDTKGEINGLLGLDILMKVGAIIDLKELKIDVNQ